MFALGANCAFHFQGRNRGFQRHSAQHIWSLRYYTSCRYNSEGSICQGIIIVAHIVHYYGIIIILVIHDINIRYPLTVVIQHCNISTTVIIPECISPRPYVTHRRSQPGKGFQAPFSPAVESLRRRTVQGTISISRAFSAGSWRRNLHVVVAKSLRAKVGYALVRC